MSRIIFYRRPQLGPSSVRGMTHVINRSDKYIKRKIGGWVGPKAGYVRNDMMHRLPEFSDDDWLVRWGCTSRTEKFRLEQQLNPSKAIIEVGMKREFRMKCQLEAPGLAPWSVDDVRDVPDDYSKPMVVRRDRHAQGKDLWLINDKSELIECLIKNNMGHHGWYAGDYVEKAQEFRVYIVEGRVVTLAEKTPEDPDAIAWNVAQGGEFNVVKWDDWNFDVIECALQSFSLTSLDFAGVDIMVGKDGRAWLIEVNSAPSLPFLSDGSISYRQRKMAEAFDWIRVHGKGNVDPVETLNNWRDVIHPAVWLPKEKRVN